jgi:hypothetical protein
MTYGVSLDGVSLEAPLRQASGRMLIVSAMPVQPFIVLRGEKDQ